MSIPLTGGFLGKLHIKPRLASGRPGTARYGPVSIYAAAFMSRTTLRSASITSAFTSASFSGIDNLLRAVSTKKSRTSMPDEESFSFNSLLTSESTSLLCSRNMSAFLLTKLPQLLTHLSELVASARISLWLGCCRLRLLLTFWLWLLLVFQLSNLLRYLV